MNFSLLEALLMAMRSRHSSSSTTYHVFIHSDNPKETMYESHE